MAWIKTIDFAEAAGKLKQLYRRLTGPANNVNNIMMIHSLRPDTMEGHMAINKYVLHNTNNTLSKWFLETIGTYVSSLNKCDYCFERHFAGLKRNLGDDAKADAMREAIVQDKLEDAPLNRKQLAALNYARKLTLSPNAMIEQDVTELFNVGYDDGEILEINQVAAYFAYANRTALGLGCSTEGDVVVLSQDTSDTQNDLAHQ